MSKKVIIVGITGQDGAYLAALLLKKGYRVYGITRDLQNCDRKNLRFLGIEDDVTLLGLSSLDKEKIMELQKEVQPDEIYNLASQSSVGRSFSDPFNTLNFNISSVINWLEAIKIVNSDIRFYQASSSEMFGNVRSSDLPLKEGLLFRPASPYGISKAAAHWVTVNYREAYGLFASCGILFNHESCLRGSEFVVKKIINGAIRIKWGLQDAPVLIGNTSIKRDWGYAPKYVEAMWLMLQQERPDDLLICSGNIMSLDELIDAVSVNLGLQRDKHFVMDKKLFRPVDLSEIYGDNTKAKAALNWTYDMSNNELVSRLIKDEMEYLEWELKDARSQ